MSNNKRKEDNKSKLAKFVSDIRSVYFVLALFGTGMAWASDIYHAQYLKVDEYHATELSKEIKALNNEVADLRIEQTYATKAQDKKRIQELIIRKKLQIQNLRGQ